ncbi:hypothetical protein [uncultured Tenacibaculum sp.]|uniref:hypothetical protein n=1 Tax=uncultured Tenacibaculum sp. TaxID=174713 RepID=UPI00260E050C|nr:hypothetical protein [uncultured Tenacibaculum sp.]
MSSMYKHWFTLEIVHSYFQNNECTVFDLFPTQYTARILKNYGIKIQKIANKFLFHVNTRDTKQVWEELNNAEDLFFQLLNADVNFDNYTDVLLPKKENTVQYITNDDVINRFNETSSVSPKILETYSLRFAVETIKEKEVVLSVRNKGKEIYKIISPENQRTTSIDIEAYGNGVYELWIDNVLSNTFYGTTEIPKQNLYAMVHINMKNAVESIKENRTPVLKVNFKARATYREYVVVVPDYKKIEIKNIKIEGIDEEKYNAAEKKEVIESLGESYVFTSTNPIAFSQKQLKHSVLKIEYVNQFSDTLLEEEMKLPVPNTSSIKIKNNQDNESSYYSQSIIYV